MFIPSTFKRPVSSWKALNLRKTLLMASSVRLKPLNCSRLPCVYAQETRSEERFSRNAETDLVCRLLLEKKKKKIKIKSASVDASYSDVRYTLRLNSLVMRHTSDCTVS